MLTNSSTFVRLCEIERRLVPFGENWGDCVWGNIHGGFLLCRLQTTKVMLGIFFSLSSLLQQHLKRHLTQHLLGLPILKNQGGQHWTNNIDPSTRHARRWSSNSQNPLFLLLLLLRHKKRTLTISREPSVVPQIRWCQNDRKKF